MAHNWNVTRQGKLLLKFNVIRQSVLWDTTGEEGGGFCCISVEIKRNHYIREHIKRVDVWWRVCMCGSKDSKKLNIYLKCWEKFPLQSFTEAVFIILSDYAFRVSALVWRTKDVEEFFLLKMMPHCAS